MIAYIAYVVILFCFAAVLCEGLAYYGERACRAEQLSEKYPTWKTSIKEHFRRRNHGSYIWPLFLILIFCIPFIYEFPGITIWTKGYVLNFYGDHSKSSSVEKMNWYGNYRKLDTTSQKRFYIDKSNPDTYKEKTFRISSNIKIVEFKVALEGKDKTQFILEMNDSFPNLNLNHFDYDPEKYVFEELGKVLRESPTPIENIEQSIEKICNDWLDKNKIHSVRIRRISAVNIPNMDRSVHVF